jgi:hypothetical protein
MPITLDRLQGPEISPSRLQDNVGKSLSQVGAIAVGGQLVSGTLGIPSVLPATVTVTNPLRRTARGAFPVSQNQPCLLQYMSSTSSTLTFSVSLVPASKNGIITGLSPLTGALTYSLWVF